MDQLRNLSQISLTERKSTIMFDAMNRTEILSENKQPTTRAKQVFY